MAKGLIWHIGSLTEGMYGEVNPELQRDVMHIGWNGVRM